MVLAVVAEVPFLCLADLAAGAALRVDVAASPGPPSLSRARLVPPAFGALAGATAGGVDEVGGRSAEMSAASFSYVSMERQLAACCTIASGRR